MLSAHYGELWFLMKKLVRLRKAVRLLYQLFRTAFLPYANVTLIVVRLEILFEAPKVVCVCLCRGIT